MEKFSSELQTFLQLIENKEKMVAMLAPSFPVDFTYPEIVGMLKRLGFSYVVEVSKGAIGTNNDLLACIEKNPKARYITSPCPTVVRLVRKKYPELIQYLAPVGSPMVQTAKIVNQKYPGYRPVFIGPCVNKKLEAKEDYPELNLLVITYKELKEAFKVKEIKPDSDDFAESFDLVGADTRLYPISGGLAQSSCLKDFMTDEEYDVISGIKLVEKALADFPTNRVKVLDILFCDGGCVSGPGVCSTLPVQKRREKVIAHWAKLAK